VPVTNELMMWLAGAQLRVEAISAGSKGGCEECWMEVMISMVCRGSSTYIRGHCPNILDFVQMRGISIKGCDGTIQGPILGCAKRVDMTAMKLIVHQYFYSIFYKCEHRTRSLTLGWLLRNSIHPFSTDMSISDCFAPGLSCCSS